jgi:hypothetical protein
VVTDLERILGAKHSRTRSVPSTTAADAYEAAGRPPSGYGGMQELVASRAVEIKGFGGADIRDLQP